MSTDMIRTADLFDLSHTIAAGLLSQCEYPWEALPLIKSAVIEIGSKLDTDKYLMKGSGIWAAHTANISPLSTIIGPCIIGENTEIRPGAYIRGSVIIGNNAVIGNSCELKNCIIFDCAQVPHFNYVGDSILGYKAHMGAGAVTSNVKADKSNIVVHGNAEYVTGLRKFGAMLGDHSETGCGCVLNPGVIIGRGSRVYPLSCVRGVIPEHHIYKNEADIAPIVSYE